METDEPPDSEIERVKAALEQEQNPVQARIAFLRSALLDSAGLDAIPEPDPIIEGVLYTDALSWLYGKPGSAKSFVALDFACCVANGLPWCGRQTRRGPVLYLIAEGVAGFRKRVRAWEAAHGQATNVLFLPIAVQLLNGIDLNALIALIYELGPTLIVIDTQARCTVGADENDAKEMGRLVAAADKLREASRGCVLIVHHSGRGGENLRGSSAFDGAATAIIKVVKDGEYVEVLSEKEKDTAEFDTVFLKLEQQGNSAVLVPRVGASDADAERKILVALYECFAGVTAAASQLRLATGLPEQIFWRSLSELVRQGRIINHGTEHRARYQLADGQEMLDGGAPF